MFARKFIARRIAKPQMNHLFGDVGARRTALADRLPAPVRAALVAAVLALVVWTSSLDPFT